MKKQKINRPVDPVVRARERGKVLPDQAPLFPDLAEVHPYQPRGPPIEPQWLTLVRTAQYLGLSTMTITRYATEAGYAHLDFPKPSIIVDRMYWSVTDIDAWMRSRVGAVSTRKAKTKSAA